ncbi:MAG TPA: aminopeptidase [Elusimicrobia bacterium]|nr:MAG: aminopeptidase [Elusimicrobia bacterium GWA2_66_18]HAZ07035.1 aminopeptidase [Elusimicrobiota bacterium]
MTKKKTSKGNLAYERKNGYAGLSAAEHKRMEEVSKDYMAFLGEGKTEREAHDEAVRRLEAAGFKDLDTLPEGTRLKAGDKVYRGGAGKTVIAVVLGRKPLDAGLHILGAHIDSPRLDVKQNPLYENGEMALLDTHYYGGIKKYQWICLPLALHGVFVRPDGKKVTLRVGEDPADPVFTITDLLPHLANDQMKKTMSEAVEGEGLDVLVGSVPSKDKKAKEKIKHRVLELLKERYGVVEADFVSSELEFVPAGPPREAGLDRSMILGYGHDDRSCAFTSLKALLEMGGVPEHAACVLLADKEEIGSYGSTGMDSSFLENAAAELFHLTEGGYDGLKLRRALERSWALSADVNALHDPLYPAVSERKNAANLNQGVILTKYTGSRGKSGASDAHAEFIAQIRRIFDGAGAQWQAAELGKVDQGGGGTIAFLLARYGMSVLDCGVGVLSMHAPWELIGKLDLYMAYKGYRAFLLDHRRK